MLPQNLFPLFGPISPIPLRNEETTGQTDERADEGRWAGGEREKMKRTEKRTDRGMGALSSASNDEAERVEEKFRYALHPKSSVRLETD